MKSIPAHLRLLPFSVALLGLMYLLVSAWDENLHLRERLADQSLWTQCKPPLANQILVVMPKWRRDGDIPKYGYECRYSYRGRVPEWRSTQSTATRQSCPTNVSLPRGWQISLCNTTHGEMQ